jgi:hypothetical protein
MKFLSDYKAKVSTRRASVGIAVVIVLETVLLSQVIFPPGIFSGAQKPIILYYDYENMPFSPSSFPQIVATTLQYHFNTLMLLVFFNHTMIFNETTLHYFYSYARSRNLTFVPSFYVDSTGDIFDASGFPWINLDMEKISANLQPSYYEKISHEGVREITVTSPYGQRVEYSPSLDIIETYAGTPWFYVLQFGYWHQDHICSVAPWLVRNQFEYNSEFQYCLRYSDGVMVFDYYNLMRSHLN